MVPWHSAGLAPMRCLQGGCCYNCSCSSCCMCCCSSCWCDTHRLLQLLLLPPPPLLLLLLQHRIQWKTALSSPQASALQAQCPCCAGFATHGLMGLHNGCITSIQKTPEACRRPEVQAGTCANNVRSKKNQSVAPAAPAAAAAPAASAAAAPAAAAAHQILLLLLLLRLLLLPWPIVICRINV